MKFKLDENFGSRTQRIFQEFAYDAETVFDEGIQGATDETVFNQCQNEQRCLVTLDLDFSNVFRFPPKTSHGIVIIRAPKNPSITLLENLIKQFLKTVHTEKIANNLWIVEIGRIRVHQFDDDE